MGEVKKMEANREKEIEEMAKKAIQMPERSLRMLIFAADILFAREEMEKAGETGTGTGP